jgi:hypothetical protein
LAPLSERELRVLVKRLPPRLVRRLARLDPEQLQIVEIVAAAIVRGGM